MNAASFFLVVMLFTMNNKQYSESKGLWDKRALRLSSIRLFNKLNEALTLNNVTLNFTNDISLQSK